MSGAGWCAVASAASGALTPSVWTRRYKSQAEWIQALAEAAGLKAGTLRRQLAVWQFLERSLGSRKLSALSKQEAPLAALEVLARLEKMDTAKAKQLLPAVLERGISYREVRKQYDASVLKEGNAPSARQLALRRRSPVATLAIDVLRANRGTFLEGGSLELIENVKKAFPKFTYLLPDLVAVGNGNELPVDGFDVRVVRKGPEMQFVRAVAESAFFRATFFRRYWVLIHEEKPTPIGRALSRYLSEIDPVNIGIVSFTRKGGSGEMQVLRQPIDGTDLARRKLLASRWIGDYRRK